MEAMTDSLEGVSLIGLLHSLQDALVDPEADGGGEGSQGHVGHDADNAELREREEQEQHAGKQHGRLLHLPPIQQIHGWERGHVTL